MDRAPRVRLEVRKAFYAQDVRAEQEWPPAQVKPTPLYLDANMGSLEREPVAAEAKAQYRPQDQDGKAAFSMRCERMMELIGSMGLKLWVSTSEGDDLDLFVVVRKLDAMGSEVFFSGYNGYERDGVAKGWLRASHRELDLSRSLVLRPWHSHAQVQKVRSGEIVAVEIEIWPSATLFEAGTTLQVTVQGHDAARYPAFGHAKLVNRGWHTIFTGGRYDSCLTVPAVLKG
jgi:predicted acyl esterase